MQRVGQIILFILITALTVFLAGYFIDFMGARNPVFAFAINWLVMTLVAILGSALHITMPLPPAYYRIRPFEANGRLYEALGVRIFKIILIRSPLALLNPTIHYKGDRSALFDLESKMRDSETGHLFIFIIMILIVIHMAIEGWWNFATWLMVFNIFFNVYPIMLQRYNRARLAPLIERMRLADRHAS